MKRKLKEIEMDRIKKLARFTRKIQTEFIKGIKPDKFMKNLKRKNIDVVVDIRWWSVYPTYFAPKNIRDLLAAHDIEYIRYRELGNPSKLRHEARENFQLAKELYLNYIIKDFKARQMFLDLFKKIRFKKNYCLICYCQTLDPKLCHRFWLKEALVNAKRLTLGFGGNFALDLKPVPMIQEVN